MLKNLQVLTFFEVKIKTYDQNGKAMKNLAQDDIQTVLMRVEDELKENAKVDFQCETRFLFPICSGLYQKNSTDVH